MPIVSLPGDPLSRSDLEALFPSGITAELVERAGLRRVDSPTGREIVCRNGSGDYAGIIFPYRWPQQEGIRDYRLRVDNPEFEWKDGVLKPRAKYLSPPGRPPMLYFPPDVAAAWLDDPTLDITLTEGEKKCLSLYALSYYGLGDAADRPRWLPIGIAGVWAWRGRRGRARTPDGEWEPVKDVISDFDRIRWEDRRVIVVFDTNVNSNPKVRWARRRLAAELRERKARVEFVNLPADSGVNGVDDLVAKAGPIAVLTLIGTGAYDPTTREEHRFPLTEIGNGERLIEEYGDDLKFCHETGEWLVWDGQRYAPDKTAVVQGYAKSVVRALLVVAANIDDKESREATFRFANRSDSDHGIKAMLNRAAAEAGVPVLQNELDSDHWLLNCKNGVVDLRSGELRPHSRDYLITKLVPVHFDPEATCPRWHKFLGEVFEPHPDVIPFIQKALGYSLTGCTNEECLFVLYGTGRNGKGTLIKTIQAMLGDYASTADFSTFVAMRDDRGPRDDIAVMFGKRFVAAQEAREGAPLAESLVKHLTGGDNVRARHLYQHSTEWTPTFHLFLGVNYKPTIKGVDVGIWSRIKLIPFDVSFINRENRNLKTTLLSELAGILRWCIEGCLMWQRDGLGKCESVETATQSYRADSDQIGRFIDERCLLAANRQIRASWLRADYEKWADENGERPVNGRTFSDRLSERGIQKSRDNQGNLYVGISLRGGESSVAV